MDWLKVLGLAMLIGVPIGMAVMAFIAQSTRCDGCCQRIDEDYF